MAEIHLLLNINKFIRTNDIPAANGGKDFNSSSVYSVAIHHQTVEGGETIKSGPLNDS